MTSVTSSHEIEQVLSWSEMYFRIFDDSFMPTVSNCEQYFAEALCKDVELRDELQEVGCNGMCFVDHNLFGLL